MTTLIAFSNSSGPRSGTTTGRTTGGLVRSYRTEDAETVVVALGSVLGTVNEKDAASAARERGFQEVAERHWDAGVEVDTHTHPFAVEALVVQGEMWLGCDGRTLHLLPGDRFELAHSQPHSERYGPAGAVYWVGRG